MDRIFYLRLASPISTTVEACSEERQPVVFRSFRETMYVCIRHDLNRVICDRTADPVLRWPDNRSRNIDREPVPSY